MKSRTTARQDSRTKEVVVYAFEKNRAEEVRATLRLADFRIGTTAGEDGALPTRKGPTLRLEQVLELLNAVRAVIEAEEQTA